MVLGSLGEIYNLRGKYKRAINYQTEAMNLLERNNLIQLSFYHEKKSLAIIEPDLNLI